MLKNTMQKDHQKYALGIDIGGTNTKLGLVDAGGSVDRFLSFPTDAHGKDPQPFIDRLTKQVETLLDAEGGSCMGIGISTHGYLDEQRRGPIVCRNTPALQGFDLVAWAENKFHKKTILNNDLIAHSLAEYYFGFGRDSHRFMCMSLGTGFGVGVIINGSPLCIVGGTTGDAGRIILDPDEVKCNYGVAGSMEALVGVSNIERLAKQYYGHPVSAHDVIAKAREGNDEIAETIIQEIGEYLGLGLASLSAIFLPHKVAITGGTAEAGEVLLNACKRKFFALFGEYQQFLLSETESLFNGVDIFLGKNRANSGVLGSVVELFIETD